MTSMSHLARGAAIRHWAEEAGEMTWHGVGGF